MTKAQPKARKDNVRVVFEMKKESYDKLKEEAKDKGLTLSSFMRMIIREHEKRQADIVEL